MIPLFHVEGNQLTSLKGEVSSFYQVIPQDTEGVERSTLEAIYRTIEADLVNTEGVSKFYFLSGKIYINSFKEVKFSQGEIGE